MIDTHAHLDDEQFKDDLEEVLGRAKEIGISKIITVSAAPGSIQNTLELTKTYDFIYGAVGLHPHDAKHWNDSYIDEIKSGVKEEKIVAVGEIGLDYHYDFSPKDKQQEVFRTQVKLAKELNYPIIVHDRDATEDILSILTDELGDAGGVIHCFTGNMESAKKYLDLGMHLSFTGILTFPKAQSIRDAAKIVPMDKFLLETDSPYLAPIPMRGKRCEPGFVKHTAEMLAEVKEVSLKEIIQVTDENAGRLFRLP